MSLTVREILKLDVLDGITVVAGAAGLDRQIRWVHIIDIPEIIPWVRGGELLLTTGYGWPRAHEEQRRTVRELNRKGLAAILFETGKFLSQIPASVLDEAEALHLPILQAPWDLAFVDITEAVSREVIRRHYENIEKSDHYRKILTAAAVEARSLDDIAEALSSLTRKSVTIEDRDFAVLGHAEFEGSVDAVRRSTLAKGRTPIEIVRFLEAQGDLSRIQSAVGPIWIHGVAKGGTRDRIVCPIRVGAELLGYVWILRGDEQLTDLDLRAAEHCAMVAALHILRQRSIAAVESRIGATVVDALIRGDVAEQDLLERAQLMGFDAQKAQVVLIVTLQAEASCGRRWALRGREDYYRRELTAKALRDLMEQHRMPPLLTFSLNQVVALVPLNTLDSDDRIRHFARNLLEALTTMRGVLPAIVTAGTPHPGTIGIPRSYWEADRALMLSRGDEGVLLFGDLTLAHLLSQVSDKSLLESMYACTLGAVLFSPRAETIIGTLWTLVDSGYKQEATAIQLGIHRNTLRSRLQQAEELLCRPLTDPLLRRDLSVAREIGRLIGNG